MLIDWFTVGAQALNFLILVWLLKRYLYQPILRAIDAREQRIAAELADAAAKQVEAKTERDAFQQKNEAFDQQRAELIQQATDAASVEGQRLLQEAQRAAEALRVKHQQTLASDARNVKLALGRMATREVFAIARKALGDLATTSLEERMVEVFTRRLRELDSSSKATLANALIATSASSPALLRSTFELPEIQRGEIQNARNESFSAEISLRFETGDGVSGIELSANGQKLEWSIAEYLTSLEQGVDVLLQENADAPVADTSRS
jgi:F-type H+-transporting ATPase subunit b